MPINRHFRDWKKRKALLVSCKQRYTSIFIFIFIFTFTFKTFSHTAPKQLYASDRHNFLQHSTNTKLERSAKLKQRLPARDKKMNIILQIHNMSDDQDLALKSE